jgi:DNA-binding beta-propeller fold protein YncE
MRGNLLRSLFCFLAVCSAVGFAARSARADAEAGQMSAPTQNSAAQSVDAQSSAPEDSNIQVENWSQPKPGWLYVLDPKPDAGGPGGRVQVIDPETDKVMGSIRTGDNADFALAPDGSRLFIASITEGDSSELAESIPPEA